jgi:hypothetical protein
MDTDPYLSNYFTPAQLIKFRLNISIFEKKCKYIAIKENNILYLFIKAKSLFSLGPLKTDSIKSESRSGKRYGSDPQLYFTLLGYYT